MSKSVRFGIIGYGKVAHLHAKALSEATGCILAAVCGRNTEKREAFAAKWGIQSFETIQEMKELGHIDAVVVTTPHPVHYDNVMESLDCGLHVLVEKPMALTVEQCTEMVARANHVNKWLGVISQRRWYPSCRRIKEAIDSGKLGKPAIGQIIMLGWRDEAYYASDPWRGSWKMEGGGVLVNQAPHQIDLLHWFMGPVESVNGYWKNLNHPYIEVEDTAVASLRFKEGGLGSILVSNSQKPGIYAKVHVHGTSAASVGVQTDGGAMFVAGMSGIAEAPYNDMWTIPGEESELTKWKEEDTKFFNSIDGTWYFFKLQEEDFARAIIDNRPPAVTGEDGLETVKIIQGIYESGKTGRQIEY